MLSEYLCEERAYRVVRESHSDCAHNRLVLSFPNIETSYITVVAFRHRPFMARNIVRRKDSLSNVREFVWRQGLGRNVLIDPWKSI
jgi:hypothetical protein